MRWDVVLCRLRPGQHLPLPSAPVTVVDAFGPTCAPCKKSLPALLAKKTELDAVGAKVVLVAVLGDGETTEQATSALRSWGVDAPFLVDRGEVLRGEIGVGGLPMTAVIDNGGTLRWIAPPEAPAEDVVSAARCAVH